MGYNINLTWTDVASCVAVIHSRRIVAMCMPLPLAANLEVAVGGDVPAFVIRRWYYPTRRRWCAGHAHTQN